MRLDLRRIGIEPEAERGHHATGERLPVDVGVRDAVRVVIADRAVDLARQHRVRERRQRAFQPRDHVGDLLSQRRRRRRLAMRAPEHRQRSVGAGERAQIGDERGNGGR